MQNDDAIAESLSPPSSMTVKRPNVMLFYATVFCTGAAVMVVELLGTRLLAPAFGVGMYVWASLISIAMLALSLGYWLGGRLADRKTDSRVFFLLPILAGCCIAILPFVTAPVLQVCESLGPRGGSLASAGILFTAPLLFLSMATPFAVRLCSQDVESAGTTAGTVYAIATVGSIAGTLLTGFYLLPVAGLSSILYMTSGLLLAMAGIGFGCSGRPKGMLLIVAGLGMAVLPEPTPDAAIVYQTDSFYSRLAVVDTESQRCLFMNGVMHTHVNTLAGVEEVTCGYIRSFDMLPACRPQAKTMLLIGLGGGSVLKTMQPFGYTMDAIEIDSDVVAMARDYFDIPEQGVTVYVEDARTFLRRCKTTYDLIILDTVSADGMPEHLCSVEYFELLRSVMHEDSVLAWNTIGIWDSEVFQSYQATLLRVFPHIRNLTAHVGDEDGNVIFFASPLALQAPTPWGDSLQQRELDIDPASGMVLRDDYNPIYYQLESLAALYRRHLSAWMDRKRFYRP